MGQPGVRRSGNESWRSGISYADIWNSVSSHKRHFPHCGHPSWNGCLKRYVSEIVQSAFLYWSTINLCLFYFYNNNLSLILNFSEKRMLILPYLTLCVVNLFLYTVSTILVSMWINSMGDIIANQEVFPWILLCIYIIVFFLHVYFFLVVLSYYNQLKLTSIEPN